MHNENKRRLIGYVFILCLAASPLTGAQQNPQLFPASVGSQGRALSAAAVKAIFAPVVGELKKRTRVPVRLPTQLPGVTTEEPQLYAAIEQATASGYTVNIDFDPDCRAATACHHGSVYAAKMTPRNSRMRGRAVRLTNGMTGYFVDAVCGASCGESTLSWKQDATLYTVAIKAGARRDLILMADSMIASAPL